MMKLAVISFPKYTATVRSRVSAGTIVYLFGLMGNTYMVTATLYNMEVYPHSLSRQAMSMFWLVTLKFNCPSVARFTTRLCLVP